MIRCHSAILGQPKPEQGRFYVAADKKGTPQDKINIDKRQVMIRRAISSCADVNITGITKDLEADKDNPNDYWDPFAEDPKQNQEYIRTGTIKRIHRIVVLKVGLNPGMNLKRHFISCRIYRPEEVGALLWLLTLNKNLNEGNDKHYFKLGYGKPSGVRQCED